MSYIINNSRGNIVAVIPDGSVNTSTSLTLIGQGVTSYGTDQNENLVYLLENFASPTAPSTPILGQLWYNSSTDEISAYSTANTFVGLTTASFFAPVHNSQYCKHLCGLDHCELCTGAKNQSCFYWSAHSTYCCRRYI